MGRAHATFALTALSCMAIACSLLTNTDELNSYVDPGGDGGGEAAPSPDGGGSGDGDAPGTMTADEYAMLVKADGPVAYWRLAETTGTTAKDEMNAFDGTWVGSPELGVAGPFAGTSRAARFKGSERVTADAIANRGVAWPGLTAEAWFSSELPPGSEGDFVQFADTSGNTIISLFRDDTSNAPKANVGDLSLNAPTTVTDGSWHHIALTIGSNVISMYLDGKLEATLAGDQPVPTTAGLFLIGADYDPVDGGSFIDADQFRGRIAEVAIYDKPLSAARIAAHRAARP